MNNLTSNTQKQVTSLPQTFLSTLTPKKILCNDITGEINASLTMSIVISLVLYYVIISLVVYAHKKEDLLGCESKLYAIVVINKSLMAK